MSGVRVKICGITNIEDARAVVDAGAHALGLVFYEASPRAVNIEQARAVAFAAGPFISVTALFVDPPASLVESVVAGVPVQLLQFHGDEAAVFCESFQRPYIKAIRMRPDLDIAAAIAAHPNASGFLLDAYRPGVPGGTGETFDWGRVPRNSKAPIVLAGGLTSENVAEAIRKTGVYGVDVSGGVESAPGKKDHNQIKSFITNARSARI
ncbi:phosphoribosylanthranilate isomerase [Cellvibrio mixtus]|uniref:phosphoribosylanthranilate isomerase n=1 Tax=Cellvibrio mixtus TaxID=39650 RepID=UPI000586E5C2|nr:phosphoribosylanthranilate isomerase [Cellvibrio mixtus]